MSPLSPKALSPPLVPDSSACTGDNDNLILAYDRPSLCDNSFRPHGSGSDARRSACIEILDVEDRLPRFEASLTQLIMSSFPHTGVPFEREGKH